MDFDIFDDERPNEKRYNGIIDASDYIVDIREYDVPYHVRVSIDKGTSAVTESYDIINSHRHKDWKMVHG